MTDHDPIVHFQLPLSVLPLLSQALATEVSTTSRMLAHAVGEREREQLLTRLARLATIVNAVGAAALEHLTTNPPQEP